MKPFNIEQAKAGKKVVTREGKPVTVKIFDLNYAQPLVVEHNYEGHRTLELHSKDGTYNREETPCGLDLFMATEKREGWVNLYPSGSDSECYSYTSGAFKTKELADKSAAEHRIACCRIEWEE